MGMKSRKSLFMVVGLILGAASMSQGLRADVISANNITIITAPPTVGSNFLINGNLPDEVIFNEQQNVTLGSALTDDLGHTIASGTVVNSHFVAFNSLTDTLLNSSVTFNGAVLGVIFLDNSGNFAATDFLGLPGTTYSESGCSFCGFESGETASINGSTVSFSNDFSSPGDFARVITAAPPAQVPEPGTLTLLAAGILGLTRLPRKEL
jgi:hypothetical protein